MKTKDAKNKTFAFLLIVIPFLNKLENPNNKPPKIAINPNNSLTVLPIHTPVTRIIKAKNGLKITFTVILISSLPEKYY